MRVMICSCAEQVMPGQTMHGEGLLVLSSDAHKYGSGTLGLSRLCTSRSICFVLVLSAIYNAELSARVRVERGSRMNKLQWHVC